MEFVKRGCLNAQSARPIAATDAVVACRDISRSSKVVAPLFTRWISSGEPQRGFSDGEKRSGCRDGTAGGPHLRLFSSGNGEAESG